MSGWCGDEGAKVSIDCLCGNLFRAGRWNVAVVGVLWFRAIRRMEEPSSYYSLPLAVDCTLSLGSTLSTTVARIAPDHDLPWSLAVRSSRTCEPSEPAMSWPGSLDAAVSPDCYSQVCCRSASQFRFLRGSGFRFCFLERISFWFLEFSERIDCSL